MFGAGFSFSGATFFQPAPVIPVQGANNGVSLNGTDVVLGNDAGTGAGGSAQLLNSREIDTNGFDIAFQNFAAATGIVVEGVTGDPSIRWAGSFLQIRMILVGSFLQFARTVPGSLLVGFDYSSNQIIMNADGVAGSLSAFITLRDVDATRSIGSWFRHDGFAGTWSGHRIQNSDAGNTSRTQFEAINNGFANAGIVMGIGSVANTIYPNTSYISVGTVSPGMFIVARSATGFIAWSIGAEGTAGEVMRLVAGGRLGIGVVAPTAAVHTKAGVAAANGAPFKYTAGVAAQTAVENGAKNFDGTNETIAAGGVTYTLAKTLTATAPLDFPNTLTLTSSDLTIALTGAALGDVVLLGVPNASVLPDSCYTAWVSAANTVTVRFNNYSAAPQDPASGTFRVSVVNY